MKYTDEELIKLVNKHKTMTYGSMEEGLIIREKEYKFLENSLYDDKVKVLLPESFHDMDPEIVKMKYPMEQRPTIIKTNEESTIDVSFNLTEGEFHKEYTENMLEYLMNVIKNFQAGTIMIDHNVEINQHELMIGWFDYMRPVIDGRLYCLIFFFELEGRFLTGGCLCSEKDMVNWKPVFMQILNSIRLEENMI